MIVASGIGNFLFHLATIAVGACLISVLASFIQRKSSRPFLLLLAIGVVGGVAGFWATNSRSAAIGDVLPGILTLMAGLGLVVATRTPEHERSVATGILCLALSFGAAATWGAYNRHINETERAGYSAETVIKAMQAKAVIEKQVNDFRVDLGLTPLTDEYFYPDKKKE